jgi:hypothetical protein
MNIFRYICFFLFTGQHHRPILDHHLANIKEQIKKQYPDETPAFWLKLFAAVQQLNAKQLQGDVAKLLMSVKQGFVHIIVYNVDSVGDAVADAIQGTENMRVYYPSDEVVNKNGLISQFVEQLLHREGNYRYSSKYPCVPYELKTACKKMKLLPDKLDDEDIEHEGKLYT